MNPGPRGLDPEEIERLYVDEGLSMRDVADRIGCSHVSVWYHLDRRGVETRPVGGGYRLPEYDREELLSWIDSFVETFGVVPSNNDIDTWPGPSNGPYIRVFGSVSEAVREAGYTPRGDR